MSLADRLNEGPPPLAKGPACTAGAFFAQLDESERAALREMLATWTAADVERTVRDEYGVRIRSYTWLRHSSGGCNCEPR